LLKRNSTWGPNRSNFYADIQLKMGVPKASCMEYYYQSPTKLWKTQYVNLDIFNSLNCSKLYILQNALCFWIKKFTGSWQIQ